MALENKSIFQKASGASLIIINNAIPLVGIFFYHWDARQIINLYWIGTCIIILSNAFKVFLIGKYGKDDSWWMWGGFSVVGLSIAVIVITSLFIQPEWEEINKLSYFIFVSFLQEIIALVLYTYNKHYKEENSGLTELFLAATKIAILMFLMIPLGIIEDYFPDRTNTSIALVVALIGIKTFFELRGGFFR